jgi:RNA polymerase sigma-70 factor (sigma-E family)
LQGGEHAGQPNSPAGAVASCRRAGNLVRPDSVLEGRTTNSGEETTVDDGAWRSGRRDEHFQAFVAARRPALVRTATLLAAGDSHLAEDLVQTALTRLYVAWPRVDRDQGPERYARRILVNALVDERRRPWRRRETSRSELPDTELAPTGASAEDRDAVRRALGELAPRMRAAVVLRHWLGYDVAECAELLSCSAGTVKSQTARGLDRLRELLSDDLTVTVGSAR